MIWKTKWELKKNSLENSPKAENITFGVEEKGECHGPSCRGVVMYHFPHPSVAHVTSCVLVWLCSLHGEMQQRWIELRRCLWSPRHPPQYKSKIWFSGYMCSWAGLNCCRQITGCTFFQPVFAAILALLWVSALMHKGILLCLGWHLNGKGPRQLF